MKAIPIVALHGTASNSKQWRTLQDSMAAQRQVIAPDLPGYGKHGSADLPTTPGLNSRIETLCQMLDRLDGPCHLIGHSFGGALALRLGELRPEQVLSISVYEPTALAVFHGCTQAWDLRYLGEFQRLAQITASASPQVAMESFVNYWMGRDQWSSLAMQNQHTLIAVAKIAARDFKDALLDLDQPQPPAWYSGPVQILRGSATIPASRRIAQLLQARLPDANLQSVKDAGHMGPMTHSSDVHTAYRDFLARIEDECEPAEVPLVASCG